MEDDQRMLEAKTDPRVQLTDRTSFCTLGIPDAKKSTAIPAATANGAV